MKRPLRGFAVFRGKTSAERRPVRRQGVSFRAATGFHHRLDLRMEKDGWNAAFSSRLCRGRLGQRQISAGWRHWFVRADGRWGSGRGNLFRWCDKGAGGHPFRDAVKMVGNPWSSTPAEDERRSRPRIQYCIPAPVVRFFRPVSRETKKTGSGPRPHFALVDELHEHPDAASSRSWSEGSNFAGNRCC